MLFWLLIFLELGLGEARCVVFEGCYVLGLVLRNAVLLAEDVLRDQDGFVLLERYLLNTGVQLLVEVR